MRQILFTIWTYMCVRLRKRCYSQAFLENLGKNQKTVCKSGFPALSRGTFPHPEKGNFLYPHPLEQNQKAIKLKIKTKSTPPFKSYS